MFLRIEKGAAAPVSRQIAQQIVSLCASGNLTPGARLPSVRELARDLEVNQNTVLRVYERLCRDGEQTVRALTDRAGVSQPAVSKHLGVLKQAGLVLDRRQGRQNHYGARPQGLAPLIDWMSLYGPFWRDRFDRLEELLSRMDQ